MNAPKQQRVLLVDDDEEILEAMQMALEEQGYEVLLARDGAEALARAERDGPALIVLDMVMPRRSGLMVLDRLRRTRFRSPRIVMVTGKDEQRHRDYAESHGVDAYLKKPFDMDHLVGIVASLLEAPSGETPSGTDS